MGDVYKTRLVSGGPASAQALSWGRGHLFFLARARVHCNCNAHPRLGALTPRPRVCSGSRETSARRSSRRWRGYTTRRSQAPTRQWGSSESSWHVPLPPSPPPLPPPNHRCPRCVTCSCGGRRARVLASRQAASRSRARVWRGGRYESFFGALFPHLETEQALDFNRCVTYRNHNPAFSGTSLLEKAVGSGDATLVTTPGCFGVGVKFGPALGQAAAAHTAGECRDRTSTCLPAAAAAAAAAPDRAPSELRAAWEEYASQKMGLVLRQAARRWPRPVHADVSESFLRVPGWAMARAVCAVCAVCACDQARSSSVACTCSAPGPCRCWTAQSASSVRGSRGLCG
jgi:hypothetical protein